MSSSTTADRRRMVATYAYDFSPNVLAGVAFSFADVYANAASGFLCLYRYYDPSTGQFLSVDPLVGVTGQAYQYSYDDPVNETDPTGLGPCLFGICLGFHPGNALKGLANFAAGLGNFAVSTATLGNVHISAPYCGGLLGISSDIGNWTGLIEAGLAGGEGAGAEEAGTYAGEQATAHGAERLAQAGFTEESVAATKAGVVLQQADGATVYLNETAPGRYDFIVEGQNGIITAHTNWPASSIQRLAQNYGWTGLP